MLLGFIADEVIIKKEENETRLDKIIIGIYDKYISKTNTYSGLVGLDIIERCDNNNEYFTNAKI